ncbi:MAG: hypothetical protein Q8R98_29395, partial [Rubrivivax sp.]|nr:hypothetical protein [Rubrivivax sp.]
MDSNRFADGAPHGHATRRCALFRLLALAGACALPPAGLAQMRSTSAAPRTALIVGNAAYP